MRSAWAGVQSCCRRSSKLKCNAASRMVEVAPPNLFTEIAFMGQPPPSPVSASSRTLLVSDQRRMRIQPRHPISFFLLHCNNNTFEIVLKMRKDISRRRGPRSHLKDERRVSHTDCTISARFPWNDISEVAGILVYYLSSLILYSVCPSFRSWLCPFSMSEYLQRVDAWRSWSQNLSVIESFKAPEWW